MRAESTHTVLIRMLCFFEISNSLRLGPISFVYFLESYCCIKCRPKGYLDVAKHYLSLHVYRERVFSLLWDLGFIIRSDVASATALMELHFTIPVPCTYRGGGMGNVFPVVAQVFAP